MTAKAQPGSHNGFPWLPPDGYNACRDTIRSNANP